MASDEINIFIDEDGSVQAIYDDDLVELFEGEEHEVRRASHVEPVAGGWAADMSPVGGPVLLDESTRDPQGRVLGFRTRAEALAAERAWLASQMAERRLGVRRE